MRKVFIIMLLLCSITKVDAQVKFQTGSAEFGLPLFQWEDDKSRLTSAVSISYSSGNGLKVSDMASNIGQGWNLQIGGSVTRIQSGEPDDQKPRDGNFDDITKYPPGYLYDPLSASLGCPKKLTEYPIFRAKNKIYKNYNEVTADKEVDRFAFEINGRSGVFILGKNNGDKGILLGDSKMKVWFTRNENMPNTRTTINAFFIQDENGVIYKFSTLQVAKVLKVRYSDPSGTYPQEQPKFEEGGVYHESSFDDGSIANPYIVNGWMLTEMEDALTHRKIFFNYTMKNTDTQAGTSLAAYTETNYSIITHSRSIIQSPQLSNISYPDGHIVTVNYGDVRFDFNGLNAVKSIDVQYGGRFISKYELNTQYFIGNRIGMPTTDYQKSMARLCLTSIRRIGIDLMSDDPPYKFDYYTGSSTPDDIVPSPFHYKKDIWGYYNGDNSKGFGDQAIANKPVNDLINEEIFGLCFIRRNGNSTIINPKSGYAKNGLLKKIFYPTGGSLKYEYEQNTGLLNGQNTTLGGVHVSKTIASDEGNNYDCNITNLTTNYNYAVASGSTQTSLWGIESPVNKFTSKSFYAPMKKRYKWGVRHCGIWGCCKYKYQYPGLLSREQAIDLDGHARFLQALSDVMDVVSLVMTIVNFVNIALGATGIGAIIAAGIDNIVGLYTLIKTCLKDYSKWTISNIYYNNELNNNPLPIQYSRVEVSANNGENGRTVMEFTSPNDYPIWEPTNPIFSNKQRLAYWAYGLAKKTTSYDALGNLVKESENIYDYQYAKSLNTEILDANGIPQTVPINTTSCKCLVKSSHSNREDWWMDMNQATPENNPAYYVRDLTSNSALLADIYSLYTGRVELRNTIERVYATGSSQYVESNKRYEYGKNLLPNVVTTTQSNGDINQTSTVYTIDSWLYGANQGQYLPTLVQNNILNLPIATKSTVKKATDNITYDLNETVTNYRPSLWVSGEIKPGEIYTRRYVAPAQVTSSSSYYKGPTATNNPTYKRIKQFEYDESANLTGTWGENFDRSSYLFDYNDKYIVASIINAGGNYNTKDRSFYTSFETSKLNGWEIIGTANYLNNAGITGNNAFVLNGANSLRASNLDGCGDYRLTFWATSQVSSIVALSAGRTVTLLNSGPTINGLTFYEYKLSSCTIPNQLFAQTVTITGSTTIDELRLYPSEARMRTTTYDPIIGKTSECDENNRITYYTYDEKGRLRFIKDEKSNVVKMYEYNNATKQPIPCAGQPPLVYSNLATSEVFIKDNCKPGEIGLPITYTIPAGTYTSTISQEVVNLLVQQAIQANGQAFANANGICVRQYSNIAVSADFTKEDCEVGYKGTTITYSVPAGQYFSTVSQAAANALAMGEVNANGQAFANTPGNASCVIDTEPDWEGVEPAQTQCGTGAQTGHQLVLAIDINPNSPTYNTTQWTDGGLNASCGGAVTPEIDITFTNAGNTQATVKFINLTTSLVYLINLSPNTSTSTVAGFVPAGNYDVTVTLPYGSNAQNIAVYNNTQVGSFHATPVNVTTSGLPIVRITL